MRAPKGSQAVLGAAVVLGLGFFASTSANVRTPDLHAAEVPLIVQGPVVLEFAEGPIVPAAPEPEPPLTSERLIQLVQETWPEDPDTAVRILVCESHAGDDPRTYDLEAPNGGPMQLDRYTWAPFFAEGYGWTWEQLVTDVHVHLLASRIIYDRAGGWSAWRC